MTYEYPTNLTDPVDLFHWTNRTLDYSFGWVIILIAGIIMFTYLSYKYGSVRAFSYTSMVSAILAGFLFMIGLVKDYHFIIFMVLAAAGLIALLSNKNE